jgi:hypothetical protein
VALFYQAVRIFLSFSWYGKQPAGHRLLASLARDEGLHWFRAARNEPFKILMVTEFSAFIVCSKKALCRISATPVLMLLLAASHTNPRILVEINDRQY